MKKISAQVLAKQDFRRDRLTESLTLAASISCPTFGQYAYEIEQLEEEVARSFATEKLKEKLVATVKTAAAAKAVFEESSAGVEISAIFKKYWKMIADSEAPQLAAACTSVQATEKLLEQAPFPSKAMDLYRLRRRELLATSLDNKVKAEKLWCEYHSWGTSHDGEALARICLRALLTFMFYELQTCKTVREANELMLVSVANVKLKQPDVFSMCIHRAVELVLEEAESLSVEDFRTARHGAPDNTPVMKTYQAKIRELTFVGPERPGYRPYQYTPTSLVQEVIKTEMGKTANL